MKSLETSAGRIDHHGLMHVGCKYSISYSHIAAKATLQTIIELWIFCISVDLKFLFEPDFGTLGLEFRLKWEGSNTVHLSFCFLDAKSLWRMVCFEADIDREATQKDHFCCRLMTGFIIRISFYFAISLMLKNRQEMNLAIDSFQLENSWWVAVAKSQMIYFDTCIVQASKPLPQEACSSGKPSRKILGKASNYKKIKWTSKIEIVHLIWVE